MCIVVLPSDTGYIRRIECACLGTVWTDEHPIPHRENTNELR